jgi:preprotein translocase subunit SecE
MWLQNAKQFYREVRNEMRQVTWPDRREVAGTTVVVIIVIFVLGI